MTLKRQVRFLTVLSISLNLLVQFFMFSFILLSGDIETNPGPCVENSLDIVHINIRSIRNKIDSLLYLVQDFDILCFTETHLDTNISNDNLCIEGYNSCFRKDRNSYGGGVMIYIANAIRACRRYDLEPNNTEILWIEIPQSTNSLLICCVYRPPNSSGTFWEKLTWSIEKANDISSNIIVLGDINVIFFNLSNTHEIHTIMNAYNLPNTIHAPTRIIHNTCSLIDQIFVSKNIQTYDSGTISHTLSDHKATFIYIHNNSESNVSYQRKVWDYKKANFEQLNSLIREWDWDKTITDTNNIEAATKNFTNQYMSFIHKCIPEKTFTIRPNGWIPSYAKLHAFRFSKKAQKSGREIGLLFVNTETRLTT